MKLEDFDRLVAMTDGLHTMSHRSSRRQNNNFDLTKLLIDGLAKCNLLSTTTCFQNGSYRGDIPRSGIVMSKVDTDAMADSEHYVYRAIFAVNHGVSFDGRNEGINSRGQAIARLTEIALSQDVTETLPRGIEMTQYGKMSDLDVPPSSIRADARFNATYNMGFSNLAGGIPAIYNAILRGEEYTLYSRKGQEGKITFRVVNDSSPLEPLSVTPLTEEDIAIARRFIEQEQEYSGWIPTEINTTKPTMSIGVSFDLYRLGDTDRSIRATTVLQKTKDRRTYFNSTTQLKVKDKRYTIPMGEYFLCPSDIYTMSMFEYDDWIQVVSNGITMSKTNSRVGFLSTFTEHDEVKSINVKTKSIGGADDDDVGPTFTRKANSGRFN